MAAYEYGQGFPPMTAPIALFVGFAVPAAIYASAYGLAFLALRWRDKAGKRRA